MKKSYWILIGIVIFIVIMMWFVLKERGEKREIDYIKEQALEIYQQKKSEGMQFSSQCLGIIGEEVKYVVDIVHVPRSQEDNKPENQCQDYREGLVSHFIELDKDGNIVRIV